MDILIIKLSPIYSLNSSMMRAMALAKGFLKLNYNVDFLTVPHSSTHTLGAGYDFLDEINVITSSKNELYSNLVENIEQNQIKQKLVDIARRLYHSFSLYDHTKKNAAKINIEDLPKKKYDIVISVSDPKTSHIALNNLIKQGLKYDKWVQYWGDPLALDITHKSIYPKFFLRKVEEKLFYKSDMIIYASPITLKHQKDLFKQHSRKMIFLPTPYIEKKIYNETDNEKIQVGYFGAYIQSVRDIKPLYSACSKLSNHVDLTIVGNSDLQLKETNNISIYERQEIDKFEEKADLLVCIANKKGTQIPGKIFHYAATNKPILLVLDGEMKKEIKDYFSQFNRYYICDNNPAAIERTILRMSKELKNESPIEQFSNKNVTKSLLSNLYKR